MQNATRRQTRRRSAAARRDHGACLFGQRFPTFVVKRRGISPPCFGKFSLMKHFAKRDFTEATRQSALFIGYVALRIIDADPVTDDW